MCTSCHTPHSGDAGKLLLSDPPVLCLNCHDKAEFNRKNVHMPVSGGMCLSCHRPHVSENIALLNSEPYSLCIGCHANVRKGPHAVTGFSSSGHPLGEPRKRKKDVEDPARPGKKFYCGSCHTPHSSDYVKLFRYKASSAFELCNYCHKM
jgi:predicted CXXCH cytochrome family protein